jgi:hypothetical protein
MQYAEQVQQQMFSMIGCWQQSGLSQKAYCEQNGIRYHVFHYWYKRYREKQIPQKEAGFVSLTLPPSVCSSAAGSAAVELLLPDGKRILFHQMVSPDYLKALIA